MRWSPTILLQCLAILRCTATNDGYLHTFDIEDRPYDPHAKTLSSSTAYSIVARRLSFAEARRLASLDDAELEQINSLGGHQIPLFSDARKETQVPRLVIVIEGHDRNTAWSGLEPLINIQDPATDLTSESHIRDLLSGTGQGNTQEYVLCGYKWMTNMDVKMSFAFATEHTSCPARGDLFQWPARLDDETALSHHLRYIDLTLPSANGDRLSAAYLKLDFTAITPPDRRDTSLNNLLLDIYSPLSEKARAGTQESTIILLPTTPKSSKTESLLHPRQQPIDEEPLTVSAPASPSLVSSPSFLHISNTSNSTAPNLLPGTFLPACFLSNETCTNMTNSCSGHGSCYAKHDGCFACKCGSTIVRWSEDGKSYKSVQWGGGACEKKDVSVQFFLFASLAVTLVALVMGGVGMLYSMGSEELPGVLGAGVVGPTARK